MFTGIIETLGKIIKIEKEQANIHFFIQCNFTNELKIDQSVAHNGTCLTVVEIQNDFFKVTAVEETLKKTNLSLWKVGDFINLERGMKIGDRLDGHIVQGHIDQIGECIAINPQNGSTIFTFQYDTSLKNVTIEKGSITVNGVSLTVINSKTDSFSVAIIPYTMEHTTFKFLKTNDKVNLEFDVIGKYVKKISGM